MSRMLPEIDTLVQHQNQLAVDPGAYPIFVTLNKIPRQINMIRAIFFRYGTTFVFFGVTTVFSVPPGIQAKLRARSSTCCEASG